LAWLQTYTSPSLVIRAFEHDLGITEVLSYLLLCPLNKAVVAYDALTPALVNLSGFRLFVTYNA